MGISEDGQSSLADIEEELAELRPLLQTQRRKLTELLTDVASARRMERHERDDLWKRQREMDTRLVQLVTRVQRTFRGFRVRKMMMELREGEEAKIASWASALPRQLRTNMKAMQVAMYKLRYRDQERYDAAVFLQSWWRCILTRRAAVILRMTSWMLHMHKKMDTAAVQIQARSRAKLTRDNFTHVLRARIEQRRRRQHYEMMIAHEQICKVQRMFRAKLSCNRVEEARRQSLNRSINLKELDLEKREELEQGVIDSGTVKQRAHPFSDRPLPEEARVGVLAGTGFVPVFCAGTSPRHSIGGASAADVKRVLRAVGGSSEGQGTMSICSARENRRQPALAPAKSADTRQTIPRLWNFYSVGLPDCTYAHKSLLLDSPPLSISSVVEHQVLEETIVPNGQQVNFAAEEFATSKKKFRARTLPRLKTPPTKPLVAATPLNTRQRARLRLQSLDDKAAGWNEKPQEQLLSHPLLTTHWEPQAYAGEWHIADFDEPKVCPEFGFE